MSLLRYVTLRVPAATAKPGPSIGQALGPLGINMAEFCKQFNERTEPQFERDTPLTVRLAALSDRTFTFVVQTPSVSYMIKKAAGFEKGPEHPTPGEIFATITPEAVYEIAKIKSQDEAFDHVPLESVAQCVIGTCRSMGVVVVEAGEEDDQEEGDSDDE